MQSFIPRCATLERVRVIVDEYRLSSPGYAELGIEREVYLSSEISEMLNVLRHCPNLVEVSILGIPDGKIVPPDVIEIPWLIAPHRDFEKLGDGGLIIRSYHRLGSDHSFCHYRSFSRPRFTDGDYELDDRRTITNWAAYRGGLLERGILASVYETAELDLMWWSGQQGLEMKDASWAVLDRW